MIVPVYNVASYLPKALDSVLSQTLGEIEVIAVDDGSTDGSGEILDQYAGQDKRMRVIHKANAGYGHSVNVGLESAVGEYVGILEPDDWMQLDMLSFLYEAAEKYQAELVRADYAVFYETGQGDEISNRKVAPVEKLYGRVCNPQELERELFYSAVMNWTGIMARAFLDRWRIRHHESPGAAYQDNGFWFQLFCRAERVVFIPRIGYMYRLDNPGSSNKNRGRIFSMNEEYAWIYAYLVHHPELHKFIGMYWTRKYENNRFTLHRLKWDRKEEYVQHFQEEFRSAQARGELDHTWFTTETWEAIELLLRDAKAFQRKEFAAELEADWRPEEQTPEISVLLQPGADWDSLAAAIASLQRQTKRNFELIVPDDGSPAVARLRDTWQWSNRLRLIAPASGSLLAESLRKARGRYITFMDSRDVMTDNLLSELHGQAVSERADIVGCGFAWVQQAKIVKQLAFRQKLHLQGTPLERMAFEFSYPDWGFPGGKLYRRTLFDEMPGELFSGKSVIDARLLHFWAVWHGKSYTILPSVLYQRNLPLRYPGKDPTVVLILIWQLRHSLPLHTLTALGAWLLPLGWSSSLSDAVEQALAYDRELWDFLKEVAKKDKDGSSCC